MTIWSSTKHPGTLSKKCFRIVPCVSHSLRLRKSCVLVVELIEADGAEAEAEALALALAAALVEVAGGAVAWARGDGVRAAGCAAFWVVAFERCRRCGRDVDTDRLRCDWTRASHGLRFAASERRDDRRVDLRARLLYDVR